MIEAGTWIAVVILGAGSLGIFAWFLADVRTIMAGRSRRRSGRRRGGTGRRGSSRA